MLAVHALVEQAQEIDGVDVLVAAVLVRDPLAALAAVVEVEHRRHRVDAQPVDVIAVEPEARVRDQEAAHLLAAVVEDRAAPLGVDALPRVRVFVEVRAVEVDEAVLVGGKVRRRPVEDHADPLLVQVIDEPHEVLRRAVARRGREEPGHLVAPRRIERVLGDGQQLDVREAAAQHVRRQLGRDLPVAEPALLLLGDAHPRPQVDLVDRDRRVERVLRSPHAHPVAVAPAVVEIPHDRSGRRRKLAAESVRVGLVDLVRPVARGDAVLVARAVADTGDLPLPDPRLAAHRQRRGLAAPTFEVADDVDAARVRRPDREVDGVTRRVAAGAAEDVRAEPLVGARVGSFTEQMQVDVAQARHERSMVAELASSRL